MAETVGVTRAMNKLQRSFDESSTSGDVSLGVIDRAHHEVHGGHHFTAVRSTVIAASTSFANLMLVKDTHAAGSRKNRHFLLDFSCDKAGTLYLLENTATTGKSAGGTTYRPLNNNRVSTIASNYKYYVNATTKNAGTTLFRGFMSGAASAGVKIGGDVGNRLEFILDPTKDYLCRFDPNEATTTCIFVAEWYEEST
jgi:hypothetical protein